MLFESLLNSRIWFAASRHRASPSPVAIVLATGPSRRSVCTRRARSCSLVCCPFEGWFGRSPGILNQACATSRQPCRHYRRRQKPISCLSFKTPTFSQCTPSASPSSQKTFSWPDTFAASPSGAVSTPFDVVFITKDAVMSHAGKCRVATGKSPASAKRHEN